MQTYTQLISEMIYSIKDNSKVIVVSRAQDAVLFLKRLETKSCDTTIIIYGNRRTINRTIKQIKKLNCKINIYTTTQLLKGDLDKMIKQFDYIVGNPPYQYGEDEPKSKKLYIDITKKIIPLLKQSGTINFITPQAILDNGQGNSIYNLLQTNISTVNYDTNKYFNIGQKVVSWTYDYKDEGLSVIENNISRKVESFNHLCKLEHTNIISILNKLSFKTNNRNKCPLAKADKRQGISNKFLQEIKDNEYNYPVFCNTTKARIKYCKSTDRKFKYSQIILPYSETWDNNKIKISDEETNEFFMVNYKEETLDYLESMKAYFESKIIAYGIIHYNSVVKSTGNNNFLFRVTEVDFSKSWTDDELYKEFNITDDEIKVIEEWYKEWKK